MQSIFRSFLLIVAAFLPLQAAQADSYADAMKVFQNAGESGAYFDTAHGYALFPTIGKGGIGIGGARGKGQVYREGTPIGVPSL